jgi:hypothetical protein
MRKIRLIAEVEGGLIQSITSVSPLPDDVKIEVIIVDADADDVIEQDDMAIINDHYYWISGREVIYRYSLFDEAVILEYES